MTTNVLNVRQVAQYPRQTAVPSGSVALIQLGELGQPYGSILARDLVATALANGGHLQINAASGAILFSDGDLSAAASLIAAAGGFLFSRSIQAPGVSAASVDADAITIAGIPVATRVDLDAARAASVTSFNLRTGDIMLCEGDILRAGGAPIRDAHFGGWITAPSVWDARANDDTVATTNWVHRAIHDTGVASFNGRTGCVVFTVADFSAATAALPIVYPTAPSPALGDASSRLATTLFVDESMADLEGRIQQDIINAIPGSLAGYAPLASPQFTGVPTAPTANPGTTTGQLATTAFVQAAIASETAGVSSFNTRTGAVTLQAADVTGVGGALLAGPAFTGTPTAPTAATATSTTQLATTAFVHAVVSGIAAGVTTFNGRSGAVTLTTADVTGAGGAPIAGPAFTGTVTAPTPAPATNNTTVATTAYVTAALAAVGTPVTSFNTRTGAVTLLANDVSAAGGALVASPTFTGVPAAPTAAPGTGTTQLATCAFVQAAIAAGTAGVTSFNSRTGAVTLTTADVTGAGGAPIASPNLTGVPTAPTAAQTSSDTTLATTAFVHAAITAQTLVSSFNSRTGAVTLSAADVSAAGGALIASPTFTGTPAAPTAALGTSSTQLATTAFVANAVSGVVSSFNGRNGAVTLTAADITGAGGALLASPAFTGTPTAPTATAGTNNTQLATTAFVQAAAGAAGAPVLWSYLAGLALSTPGTTSFFVRPGVAADSTNAKMMTLASQLQKTQLAWAAGNGQGSLDTGTIANNTWYHVFLIMRPDTSAVDVLISLSATAPALTAPYTLFRRIGSLRNSTSSWVPFVQQGDEFLWSNGVFLDANGVSAVSTARTAQALTVPPGVVVRALYRMVGTGAGVIYLVTSPDELDQTASSTSGGGMTIRTTTAGDSGAAQLMTRTNTSAQIMVRSSATASYYISTYGWIDRRGQDA